MKQSVRTKSIRLTSDEADALQKLVAITGEVEAQALKRAALRGLQELRFEQGTLAFLRGQDSAEAADVAGVPRAIFLQMLMDRGVVVLQGPSTLAAELESLGEELGSEPLRRAARTIANDQE